MESPRRSIAGVAAMVLALLAGAATGAQQKLNDPLPRAYGRFRDFGVSPDGARVVYAAEQDLYDRIYPRYELYSVPLDGSASSVKLSGTQQGWDWKLGSFRFSPDGGRVAFVLDYVGALMIVPSDGSAPAVSIAQIACETCDDSEVEYGFTPDGSHILFRNTEYLSAEDIRYPLYGVPADGSAPAVRLSEPSMHFVESFSATPDGTRVAFTDLVAYPDYNHGWHLYGRPIDASAPTVRLDPDLTLPDNRLFAIAPDGMVVFPAYPVGGALRLYAAPIDGSAAPLPLSGPFTAGADVDRLVLVPDGSRVVYTADALLDGRREVFVVPLDASAPPARLSQALAPGGSVGNLELAPGGAHAVYLAQENGVTQVFSVRTDGSRPALRLNADLVAGGNASSFLIVPDGRWVVYLADQRVDGKLELFGVPIDRGERPRLRQVGAPHVRRLNAALPAGSSGVSWYAFARDAGRVLYRADGETLGDRAVFAVSVRGGSPVRVLAQPFSGGFFAASAPGASILPGSRAAFVIQPDFSADRALVSVPMDASQPPLRLNPPLARGPTVGTVIAYDSNPDGDWTVYVADQEVDDVFELYSVPTGGGAPPVRLNGPLPYGGDVSDPIGLMGAFEITPDGGRVVYVASQDVNGEFELYVAPIEGFTPAVRLGSGSDVRAGFALDASGTRVVFLRRDAQGTERLCSQRLDGSEAPLDLTGTLVAGGSVEAFALAPDGTRVVFRADAELDQRLELYSVPADASAQRVRLSPALASNRDVGAFAIAPDSSRVLFLADARVDERFELYSAPLGGGQPPFELDPALVGTGTVLSFVASPDGARVVFVATATGQRMLYSVPCDASAPPHRLDGPLVAGGNVLEQAGTFLVTPDSRRVAYLADQDTDGKLELYSAPIDGSSAARKLSDPLGGPVRALDDSGHGTLRSTPDSRRVLFPAYAHPSGSPNPVRLFAAGIAGAGPPLRLTPPDSSVLSFELDPFGLYALYRDAVPPELLYVPTDAARSPRRVDLDPGPCAGVERARFTADVRFALYLDEAECDVIELYSFPPPRRLRGTDPPATF